MPDRRVINLALLLAATGSAKADDADIDWSTVIADRCQTASELSLPAAQPTVFPVASHRAWGNAMNHGGVRHGNETWFGCVTMTFQLSRGQYVRQSARVADSRPANVFEKAALMAATRDPWPTLKQSKATGAFAVTYDFVISDD